MPQDTRGAAAYCEWLRRTLRQREALEGAGGEEGKAAVPPERLRVCASPSSRKPVKQWSSLSQSDCTIFQFLIFHEPLKCMGPYFACWKNLMRRRHGYTYQCHMFALTCPGMPILGQNGTFSIFLWKNMYVFHLKSVQQNVLHLLDKISCLGIICFSRIFEKGS